jgi:hypothetical protein
MKDNISQMKNKPLQRSTVKVRTDYKNVLKKLSVDKNKTISILTEEALEKVYKISY